MNRAISKFLLFLSICTFFISCASEDFSNENYSNDEIIVEAHIGNGTRATKLTNSNLTTFGMYGYYNGAIRINNVNYTKNETSWKSSKPVTWAAGAMNFYAISPSFNISTSKLTETMTASSQTFDYTVPTNANEQFDILYSSVMNLMKSNNNGKIVFSFKPGMHYFGFTAQNTIGTGYQVFAKKLIIHNMITNGTFAFGTTANTADWTAASDANAIYGNETFVFDTPIEITSTKTNLTGDQYFIVMPQKITKWATTDAAPIPISTADNNKNWYVEVVGQIIKTNDDGTKTYLLGNVDDSNPEKPQYESVYFPQTAKTCKISIGSTWNIVFNGGYNQNGETYLDHLDNGGDIIVKVAEWFPSSIDVEEWTPYSENIEF